MSLQLDCEVHAVSTIHGYVFDLTQAQVQGLIRVGLSLQLGSHMGTFRRALRDHIRRVGVVVRVVSPPSDAIQWRRKALQLFAGRGLKAVERLALDGILPLGDWRKPGRVEVYVSAQERARFSDAYFLQRATRAIEYTTSSSAPRVYARHRWTGMALSLDALGRVCMIHNLLPGEFELCVCM